MAATPAEQGAALPLGAAAAAAPADKKRKAGDVSSSKPLGSLAQALARRLCLLIDFPRPATIVGINLQQVLELVEAALPSPRRTIAALERAAAALREDPSHPEADDLMHDILAAAVADRLEDVGKLGHDVERAPGLDGGVFGASDFFVRRGAAALELPTASRRALLDAATPLLTPPSQQPWPSSAAEWDEAVAALRLQLQPSKCAALGPEQSSEGSQRLMFGATKFLSAWSEACEAAGEGAAACHEACERAAKKHGKRQRWTAVGEVCLPGSLQPRPVTFSSTSKSHTLVMVAADDGGGLKEWRRRAASLEAGPDGKLRIRIKEA